MFLRAVIAKMWAFVLALQLAAATHVAVHDDTAWCTEVHDAIGDSRYETDCYMGPPLCEALARLNMVDRGHVLRVTQGPAWLDVINSLGDGGMIGWSLPIPFGPEAGLTRLISVPFGRHLEGEGREALVELGLASRGFCAVADTEADGLPDACSASLGSRAATEALSAGDDIVVVVIRMPAGTMRWETRVPVSEGSSRPWAISPPITASDFDLDGVADIVVAAVDAESRQVKLVVLSAVDGEVIANCIGRTSPLTREQSPRVPGDVAHPGVALAWLGQHESAKELEGVRFALVAGQSLKLITWGGSSNALDVRELFRATNVLGGFGAGLATSVGDLGDAGPELVAVGAPGPHYASVDSESGRPLPPASSASATVNEMHERAGAIQVQQLNGGSAGFRAYGQFVAEEFGTALTWYPDVSGDGLPELIVAAPELVSVGRGAGVGGRLRMIDGATGGTISEWPTHTASEYRAAGGSRLDAFRMQGLGASLGLCPDYDGDGLPEILASVARGVAVEPLESISLCPRAGVVWVSSLAFVPPAPRDNPAGR